MTMTVTKLPATPTGETRAYKVLSDHDTGKPYALAAVHTTPDGTHADRWTTDQGWVAHGPTAADVMGATDADTDVAEVDSATAQQFATAGLGGTLSVSGGPCSYTQTALDDATE